MEKYGFVYIWYDRKHKRYYIGAHWGRIDDGYKCSSKWMRDAHSYRPGDFKRRILVSNIPTRKEMFEEENRWLALIKDHELGKRYYNLQKTWVHWSADENKMRAAKEKMSIGVRKNLEDNGSWWSGKKHSDEAKKKQSESAKTRKSSSRKGIKWSEEAKLRNKGRKDSLETRKKKSLAGLGNKNGMGNSNHLGHKHTEDTKKIISEKAKARRSESRIWQH